MEFTIDGFFFYLFELFDEYFELIKIFELLSQV